MRLWILGAAAVATIAASIILPIMFHRLDKKREQKLAKRVRAIVHDDRWEAPHEIRRD